MASPREVPKYMYKVLRSEASEADGSRQEPTFGRHSPSISRYFIGRPYPLVHAK